MLDLRNRALAEVTHADDFIVSARLVSLLMAQVAENAHLNAVFADLFDQDGLRDLPATGRRVRRSPASRSTFATIVASARRRGEVAIGYRRVSGPGRIEREPGRQDQPAEVGPGDARRPRTR